MGQPQKVFIAEGSALIRERLAALISEFETFELVGQAGSADEAIEAGGRLRPDIVLMDIRLPGGNGLEVLEAIKRDNAAPVIIMLTAFPYPQHWRKCVEAGAEYLFDKITEFECIVDVLERLQGNGRSSLFESRSRSASAHTTALKPGGMWDGSSGHLHGVMRPVAMPLRMEIPIEVLLVEDNPGDIRLMQEALRENRVYSNLHIVNDGVEALAFLHKEGGYTQVPRPDVVLLDINMPRKDGREVLAEIKTDERLRSIPVVVLTGSEAEEDMHSAYALNANCYMTKPMNFDRYVDVVKSIETFCLMTARLPTERAQ